VAKETDMAKKEFIIEFEFTSTKADGDSYKRTAIVKAYTPSGALAVARIVGFQEFGARFNDNCIDWRVINN
jgi:squalene cyclase